MSIAVQNERFILTAKRLRNGILPVITRNIKLSGGNS
jgi:hypothetical protein